MKLRINFYSVLASGVLAALSQGCETSQATLAAQAKISKADAEKIGLGKVPSGVMQSSEIEKENGKLVWSLDIATPGTKDITEVLVDAQTGAVISMEAETPEQQAKETKK